MKVRVVHALFDCCLFDYVRVEQLQNVIYCLYPC